MLDEVLESNFLLSELIVFQCIFIQIEVFSLKLFNTYINLRSAQWNPFLFLMVGFHRNQMIFDFQWYLLQLHFWFITFKQLVIPLVFKILHLFGNQTRLTWINCKLNRWEVIGYRFGFGRHGLVNYSLVSRWNCTPHNITNNISFIRHLSWLS